MIDNLLSPQSEAHHILWRVCPLTLTELYHHLTTLLIPPFLSFINNSSILFLYIYGIFIDIIVLKIMFVVMRSCIRRIKEVNWFVSTFVVVVVDWELVVAEEISYCFCKWFENGISRKRWTNTMRKKTLPRNYYAYVGKIIEKTKQKFLNLD